MPQEHWEKKKMYGLYKRNCLSQQIFEKDIENSNICQGAHVNYMHGIIAHVPDARGKKRGTEQNLAKKKKKFYSSEMIELQSGTFYNG